MHSYCMIFIMFHISCRHFLSRKNVVKLCINISTFEVKQGVGTSKSDFNPLAPTNTFYIFQHYIYRFKISAMHNFWIHFKSLLRTFLKVRSERTNSANFASCIAHFSFLSVFINHSSTQVYIDINYTHPFIHTEPPSFPSETSMIKFYKRLQFEMLTVWIDGTNEMSLVRVTKHYLQN